MRVPILAQRAFEAMSAGVFSLVFVACLAATLGARLWLSRRQIAHVRSHRGAVPAAFAGRIPDAAHAKAADYTVAKETLGEIETCVDALLLLALTLGGGLAALFAWTEGVDVSPLWRDVLLLASIAVVSGVVGLPFAWWQTFRVEERFGFNRTTLELWLTDLAKMVMIAAVLGLPVALAAVWLMKHAGALWWIWVWAAWMAFQMLLLVLFPTVIAPWFNKFSPMPDSPARARIEALLARCGFAAKGLFVADGSKRSGHSTAYFTGFGRARRVVFYDTLLARLTPDEIEAVLAHELGHFKLRHVVKRVMLSAVLSLAFLGLLAWLATKPWFYAGLGIPADAVGAAMARPGVALALFMLALPVFTFALGPLGALYSRKHEFEADAFAARHASATALTQALVKLYEDNASTLTPDPLHSAFYDSHPPAAIRVARLDTLAAAAPLPA